MGTVSGPGAAPVAGASLEARAVANGQVRRGTTDRDGKYRLSSLVPGDYAVTATLAGFAPTERTVALRVGTVVVLDLALEPVAEKITVSVTANVPLVEPTESDLSTVIEEKEIQSLPLDGRTFSDLAILVPGATIGASFDPSKYQKNAISIGAQFGRGIDVVIDGGDNNDDVVGGLLQHYSQSSIQEFEVITQRFKAEYGRSPGGVISVVTKSGTNQLRGDAFAYYRGGALDTKDYFEKKLGLAKRDYYRLQWGATLGGPIVKDRAHFFIAYERQDERAYHVVNTSGFWPELDGSYAQPFDQDLVTLKLTGSLTDRQFLTLRFGGEDNHRENDFVDGCATCLDGAIQDNHLASLLIDHTWIPGGDVLNELTAQYSSYGNTVVSPAGAGPTLKYPHAVLGGNSSTPQETIQKKYEWKDDFSLHSGSHDFKAGVDWIHSPSLGGDVQFIRGSFYYSVDDPAANPTYFFGFSGDATFQRKNDQIGVYIQDDWSVGGRLVLDLGLRYDVEFGTFDVPETFVTKAMRENPSGRKIAGIERAWLENDVDNVGPRLGFAWDLRGDGRSIVRGGWGIFYDQIFLNVSIFDDLLANDPPYTGVYVPICGDGQPCFGPGNIPADVFGDSNFALVFTTSPDLVTPYTVQSSLGISQQIGSHMALDVDLVNTDGHHEIRNRHVNHADPVTGERAFGDAFGDVRLEESTGESHYQAVQLSLRGRWPKVGFLLSASVARAEAHESEFVYSYPQDNTRDNAPDHQPGDIGRPSNLEPWRIVASGVWQLPARFQLSAIVQAAGPRPYDDRWGYDRNGDGVPNDRVGEFNRLNGDPTFLADARVAKVFAIGKDRTLEASVDVFNIFDTVNFGNNYDGTRYPGKDKPPSPSYRTPTSTLTPPRRAQLGLRFSF
ncbi:MAG: TonB-dependent receptor [Acidobacteriota bacterium]